MQKARSERRLLDSYFITSTSLGIVGHMTASTAARNPGEHGASGAARWLVMIVSVAGMLAAAATLVLIWTASGGTATPLPTRIYESTSMAASLLVLGTTILIAWRAGDHSPNVALALSFAFVFGNDAFVALCEALRLHSSICVAVDLGTFILGAGFYIRAAQCFPHKLTPHDIASSRTIWSRFKPARALLNFFLHAPAVWVFVGAATLLTALAGSAQASEASRLTIVLTGLVYIYLMYRTGDGETRRKVLWFLEVALATLLVGLLLQGVRAVLHGPGSSTPRLVISVALISANYLINVICICSAVFYTGAISPVLVIRKTFVYGATTALLLFTYATVEAFVVNVLVDKLGVNDRFAGVFLGTVLALAFHPIKNRMEHVLRRLQPANA